MNANSGYIGYSMSRRAAEAYEDGQKPLSKWTKSAILEEIKKLYGEDLYNIVKDWKHDRLKSVFLESAGWHHTSKYFNKTYFYEVIDCIPYTPEDLWASERPEYFPKPSAYEANQEAVKALKPVEIERTWRSRYWQAEDIAEAQNRLSAIVEQEQQNHKQQKHDEIQGYLKQKFVMFLAEHWQKIRGTVRTRLGKIYIAETSTGKKEIILRGKTICVLAKDGKVLHTFPEKIIMDI